MGTDFWVELRGTRYDAVVGWHCSALSLPKAELKKIIIGNEEKPLARSRRSGVTSPRRGGPSRKREGNERAARWATIAPNRRRWDATTYCLVYSRASGRVGSLDCPWAPAPRPPPCGITR